MTDLATIPHRDGETYVHALDGVRLNEQQQRVWDVMVDGCWRTLERIHELTGDPITSISARLRDFRKARFGSHAIKRRRLDRGLHEYRLVVNRKDLFA